MNVKIEKTTRELRPLKGSQDQETLYTGILVDGVWRNIRGDQRSLYGKVVDLELNGSIAKFTHPQTPPAPAEKPPAPPPPTNGNGGHTAKWASRDDAVAAYLFFFTQLEPYIKEPPAIVRAVNCLMMAERDGEINPVHRKGEVKP